MENPDTELALSENIHVFIQRVPADGRNRDVRTNSGHILVSCAVVWMRALNTQRQAGPQRSALGSVGATKEPARSSRARVAVAGYIWGMKSSSSIVDELCTHL